MVRGTARRFLGAAVPVLLLLVLLHPGGSRAERSRAEETSTAKAKAGIAVWGGAVRVGLAGLAFVSDPASAFAPMGPMRLTGGGPGARGAVAHAGAAHALPSVFNLAPQSRVAFKPAPLRATRHDVEAGVVGGGGDDFDDLGMGPVFGKRYAKLANVAPGDPGTLLGADGGYDMARFWSDNPELRDLAGIPDPLAPVAVDFDKVDSTGTMVQGDQLEWAEPEDSVTAALAALRLRGSDGVPRRSVEATGVAEGVALALSPPTRAYEDEAVMLAFLRKVAAMRDAAEAGDIVKRPTDPGIRKARGATTAAYRTDAKDSIASMFTDENNPRRVELEKALKGSDIDHTVELQLGGTNRLENLKALDLSVNRSVGSQIKAQLNRLEDGTRIRTFEVAPRKKDSRANLHRLATMAELFGLKVAEN